MAEITLLDLKRKEACRVSRIIFLDVFGRKATISKENFDKFYSKFSALERTWFVKAIFSWDEVVEFYQSRDKLRAVLYSEKEGFRKAFFDIYDRRNNDKH
jgi:hypothetical protein